MDNPSDELDIQPIIDSEAVRRYAEKMEDMRRQIGECLRKAWDISEQMPRRQTTIEFSVDLVPIRERLDLPIYIDAAKRNKEHD